MSWLTVSSLYVWVLLYNNLSNLTCSIQHGHPLSIFDNHLNMCKLLKKTWNDDQAMSISFNFYLLTWLKSCLSKNISNNHQDFKTLHCGPRRKHGVMACYCSILIVSPHHHHSLCHPPRKLHYSILWPYTRLSSHRENKLQLSIYSFLNVVSVCQKNSPTHYILFPNSL